MPRPARVIGLAGVESVGLSLRGGRSLRGYAGVVPKWWRVLAVVLVVLLVVGAGAYQLMNARTFQLFGGLTSHVDTNEKLVALTFDDGPGCDQVDAIQAALGVTPATFFVVGEAAARCPEGLARLVASGHELGNHTQTHRRMVFVTPDDVTRQIEPVDRLIREAGQAGTILVRPPNGKKLVVFPAWLAADGRRTIMWDVAVEEFYDGAPVMDAAAIASHTVEGVRPGSIILLHPWSRQTHAREAIPLVIAELRARGYRFVTVSDLLAAG